VSRKRCTSWRSLPVTTTISDDGAHTPEERGLGAGPSRPASRRASDKRCPGRAGRGKASPRAIAERRRWTASRPRQPLAGSPPAGRSPETAGDQPGRRRGACSSCGRKGARTIPGECSQTACLQKSMGGARLPRARCESSGTGRPSLSPCGRGQGGAGSRLEAAKPTSTVAGVMQRRKPCRAHPSMEGALDRRSRCR
jgi:hypothetical protein